MFFSNLIQTPTLINVDRHRDETLKPVTSKTIAQNIEYVRNGAENAWNAGKPQGLPGWLLEQSVPHLPIKCHNSVLS
jgi:hypothetical protein